MVGSREKGASQVKDNPIVSPAFDIYSDLADAHSYLARCPPTCTYKSVALKLKRSFDLQQKMAAQLAIRQQQPADNPSSLNVIFVVACNLMIAPCPLHLTLWSTRTTSQGTAMLPCHPARRGLLLATHVPASTGACSIWSGLRSPAHLCTRLRLTQTLSQN